MKNAFYLIVCFVCFTTVCKSQYKRANVTDAAFAEYIFDDGTSGSNVAAAIQGGWSLASGAKKMTPLIEEPKKINVVVVIPKGTSTSTITLDGGSDDAAEVNIKEVVFPQSAIAATQKEKLQTVENPSINFNETNGTFTGFTGFNKFCGRYKTDGNKITILSAVVLGKMVSVSNNEENSFLQSLKMVKSFSVNNGVLDLLNGQNVVLSFSKK